jgi:hypothetical protein
MASKTRKRTKASKRTLKHFFLNGDLYERLHINQGKDEITAWNYPLGKRVVLSYTQTRRDYKPAYTTKEVGVMLNRGRGAIMRAILNGYIEEPQFTYGLNEARNKGTYFWDEKLIMDAHAYFSTVHKGRPRKDGKITPMALPTPRELRAMIRQEETLYYRDGEEFVPTWAAEEF